MVNSRKTGFAKYYTHPKLQNKYAFIVAVMLFISINLTVATFLVTMAFFMKNNGGSISIHDASFSELLKLLIIEGLVIYLVCCSLGFLITIFLTHRFVGPLARIKNVVDGLTAGAPQDVILLRNNDEMTDLAQSINQLSQKLKSK